MEISRRSFMHVGGVAGVATISGCSLLSGRTSPPSGSIIVENNDSLPHLVAFSILNGPQTAPEVESNGNGTTSIEPDSEHIYKNVLTKSGNYNIKATVDSGNPIRITVDPSAGSDGSIIRLSVNESGSLNYTVERR
ncbi:hypothetical protein [Haladaptatus caseinilyticus]|uniref:hypothetical protein n=1 Tax=Haladaptatus caseinilyticus TaxID=2993314 RepID=UPI00224AB794|nr:hypothetical protein [Haladaptatus caseinilyticus]